MIPKEFDLKDKTIIIAGAARGVGKGIVEVFVEAGAKVLVTALTDRYLGPLADRLEKSGTPIETFLADATSTDGWNSTVQYAIDKWGHVDVLVNTLGDAVAKPVIAAPGEDEDTSMSEKDWNFIIDINLKAIYLGCKAIGPHFRDRGKGKVINIGAWIVRKTFPGFAVWSATKAAVHQLTAALGAEWGGYGINVNGIAPGGFPDKETNASEIVNFQESFAKKYVPMGRRYGELREAGMAALFLASDASNFMTGEMLYLDGGMSRIHGELPKPIS